MIRSMTGFTREIRAFEWGTLTIELSVPRSLNLLSSSPSEGGDTKMSMLSGISSRI
jgi:uncharacterized protein YicC (UPF0701 family)